MDPASWAEGRFPASVLIVVAHPDDEVIGAGALLSRLPCVNVIHATDGAPRDGKDARAAGLARASDYAALRRREAEAALAIAGIGASCLQSLAIADQTATLNLVPLVRELVSRLRSAAFETVVTHAYEGGHPDHDATAFAVHLACALLKRSGDVSPDIVELTGYHGAPRVVTGEFLPHPEAGPVTTVELDEQARALKQRMIECHASQGAVLAPFSRERERFRRAPPYDFTEPPHPGALHYEQHDWGMTGERWRAEAQAARRRLISGGGHWRSPS